MSRSYICFSILILVLIFAGVQKAWAQEQEVTFEFTGGQQSFVVPPGVFSVHIEAWGAQGADVMNEGTGPGGLGGFSGGDLAVTPGQTLQLFVGGQGTAVGQGVPGGGGFNGGGDARGTPDSGERGGGGGASDVRVGGTGLNDRVIVAAGGGGSCGDIFSPGGDGGGLTGDQGGLSEPGQGGTQDSGGDGFLICLDGEFGLGGDSPSNIFCAGGGGGWFGGGAGCGGGGGSSFIGGVENGETNSGVREGDGLIILTFTPILRNIPTLSEWGLIAMACMLGLVGLLAVRRRIAAV